MRAVYLAYPIDSAGNSMQALFANIGVAKEGLVERGVDVIYDPGDAFMVRKEAEPGPEIRAVNDEAFSYCDGVLAVLPSGVPTTGVPIEIDRAINEGKPVAICTDRYTWMFAHVNDDTLVRPFGLTIEDFIAAAEWLAGQDTDPINRQMPLMFELLCEGCNYNDGPDEFCPAHGREDLAAILPTKAYEDDAGFDLYVRGDHVIQPKEFVDLPTGLAVQLPAHTYGRIIGRSSTLRKYQLLVSEGIIDTGWRGPLFAGVQNLTSNVIRVQHGTRLAQLLILPNLSMSFKPVTGKLQPHPRGWSGFGSSGV